jgi:hypothetical protein
MFFSRTALWFAAFLRRRTAWYSPRLSAPYVGGYVD